MGKETHVGWLERVEEINRKIVMMDFEEIAKLMAIHRCPINELARRIAKSKGLKDSHIAAAKKNEPAEKSAENFTAACMIYLGEKYIEEKIRSDKVVEGVLTDICNGVERIAESFEWRNNFYSKKQ